LCLLGAACAFVMGALAGNALDGRVRTITVARVRVPALKATATR
jgi:hypothetical protein